MNAVGIDVSKGKSMIAIMRPFGEVVASPFEVGHTESELEELARFLKSLPGETRVLMEYTGRYYEPIAWYLHETGIFVSLINAILAHDYQGNSIRKVKTDKADAVKLACKALNDWTDLRKYTPEDEIRQTLKICNRQYNQYGKLRTMLKNNLIALLDQTFPNVNKLFTSPARKSDGHEKWVDFAMKFWHVECVCGTSLRQFKDKYERWCKKNGYYYNADKAEDIYTAARGNVGLLPAMESVTQAIGQLQAIEETLAALMMQRLVSTLPEYEVIIL